MRTIRASTWILGLVLCASVQIASAAICITSDGNDNTACGTGSLPSTGVDNSAFGFDALAANVSGNYNTAVGTQALADNTSAAGNTGVGYQALFMNTTGQANTAVGDSSLLNNNGTNNTSVGYGALTQNTSGGSNTAVGASALSLNTTAEYNTAAGYSALNQNSTGTGNTASGALTLYYNTTGSYNTGDGYEALADNSTGGYNTAIGYNALYTNSTGSYTTAVGANALTANTSGGYNTGFGAYALNVNTTGSGNTAFGYAALRSTTSGGNNIGFGYQALYQDPDGSNNIAMGYQSGFYVTGSNTIEIGSMGAQGDNDVIRLGTQGTQTLTFIAGISGTTVTGAAVYVTSSGQLGVQASSERYKTAIVSLGADTEKLRQLRPVSFHLKSDPKGAAQYGLIAEEVNKVYPELVIRDQSGQIQGVHYEELAPMLLSQVQRQQRTIDAQAEEIRKLKQQQGAYVTRAEFQALAQQLQAALLKQQSAGEGLVAQR
jgi:hypothetical protein